MLNTSRWRPVICSLLGLALLAAGCGQAPAAPAPAAAASAPAAPVLGQPSARVTVVEWGDFQ